MTGFHFSARIRTLGLTLTLLLLAGCDGVEAPEHLGNAEGYFAQGDFKTAVVELKNALQKDPDLGAARLLLARAYEIQGQYADALREFERAQNLGVDSPYLEPGLLGAKNRMGRYQEVIGALEDRDPLPDTLVLVLADAYLAGEDLTAAEPLYARIADTAGGASGLGTIAWVQGDVIQAADLFQRAVTLDPESRESWVRRGELALAEQRYPDAADSFATAKSLPGGAASGGLGLARTFLAEGRLDEALIEVEAVLQTAPGLYLASYVEALIRYGLDDVDGAETALRQVQRVVPDHTPSLYLMGAVKYRQGQLNQAEGSLLRYLARDRHNESAAKLLALIRAQKNDLNGTIDTLAPFAQSSTDPQLLAMLGTAQLRQGRLSEATETLERAVELAPDAAAFRNQLALSLLSAGEEERAVVELESAISVDTDQFQSDYLLAMLNLKKREFQAAANAAGRMIEKSPGLPIGFNLQGAARLGQGDETGARASFEQALTVAPDFMPAAQNLARLDAAGGDLAGAMDRYRGVIAAAEGNTTARLALADLAAGDGNFALAREQLDAVLMSDPDSLRARLGLARLALRDGRIRDAQAEAAAALRLAPDSVNVLLINAETAFRSGDREAARQHALALDRVLERATGLPQLNPETWRSIARLQREVRLTEAARETLGRAASASGSGLSDTRDPYILAELVWLNLADGKAGAARADLVRLRAADQEAEDLALLEAEVLALEGREDAAIDAFARLAAAGERPAVMRLATLRQQRGEMTQALALLDEWLAAHPDDTGAQLLRANALLTADRAAAIATYEGMADSGNPVALNNLAWLYMEAGDDRAVATAERALSLAPDNADIADTLGWILVRRGEPEKAISHIRRSSEARPENATIRYHLGVAYLDAGRIEAGRRALEEAMGLGAFPEREDAERRLAAIGEV